MKANGACAMLLRFSVQTWSAAGWLRVDFSQGSAVSSLVATWNSSAPTVQIFAD